MEELFDAIQAAQAGDRSRARALFEEILKKIGDDPVRNCILAHYMADVQDQASDELLWDLRSLQYLDLITEDRVTVLGASLKTEAFYASIYLNIANSCKKTGDSESALKYLERARESSETLESDGYGTFLRNGIRDFSLK